MIRATAKPASHLGCREPLSERPQERPLSLGVAVHGASLPTRLVAVCWTRTKLDRACSMSWSTLNLMSTVGPCPPNVQRVSYVLSVRTNSFRPERAVVRMVCVRGSSLVTRSDWWRAGGASPAGVSHHRRGTLSVGGPCRQRSTAAYRTLTCASGIGTRSAPMSSRASVVVRGCLRRSSLPERRG